MDKVIISIVPADLRGFFTQATYNLVAPFEDTRLTETFTTALGKVVKDNGMRICVKKMESTFI